MSNSEPVSCACFGLKNPPVLLLTQQSLKMGLMKLSRFKSQTICIALWPQHFFLPGLIDSLHSGPIPLHVDLSQLCIINNFKETKAAKLGPPLSPVMTNELSLRLCISLAPLWPYPGERATAVPSHEQVSPNRWHGNRMEIETIGIYLGLVWASRTGLYSLASRCIQLTLYWSIQQLVSLCLVDLIVVFFMILSSTEVA